VVHVTWWLDDCAEALESMAAGTFDPEAQDEDIERINAGHVERAAALTTSEADHRCAAARDRMRSALTALPEVTPEAWVWFEESGPMHELKHVSDLQGWLAGVPGEPDIGGMLDAETKAWIAFATLLDRITDDDARDDDGFRAADIAHHLSCWMGRAAAGVETNRGLPPSDAGVDDRNATYLAESAELTLAETRGPLEDARLRLRLAFAHLPHPSPEAREAFTGDTTEHYEEHLAGARDLAARSS
jgi:hypothetical protein